MKCRTGTSSSDSRRLCELEAPEAGSIRFGVMRNKNERKRMMKCRYASGCFAIIANNGRIMLQMLAIKGQEQDHRSSDCRNSP